MKMMKKLLRKSAITLAISSMTFVPAAYAQTSAVEMFLSQIDGGVYAILNVLNQSPAYIQVITQMAQSFVSTNDPGNFISTDQAAFSAAQSNSAGQIGAQFAVSYNLMNQYLLAGSSNPNAAALPSNANELFYQILWGATLPNTSTPKNMLASQQNYIANLSGAGIQLPQPNPSWSPTQATQNYTNFYNTIAAAFSYNSFILAGLMNDKNNYTTNTTLANMASSSSWFSDISTEPLGMVMRQILMFSSQIYVAVQQSILIQQQMLIELASLNTIISLVAQQNTGPQLWMRAQQAGSAPVTPTTPTPQ